MRDNPASITFHSPHGNPRILGLPRSDLFANPAPKSIKISIRPGTRPCTNVDLIAFRIGPIALSGITDAHHCGQCRSESCPGVGNLEGTH